MKNKINTIPIPPAQLWIGNHTNLIKQTKKTLQKLFCTKNGCGRCFVCKQIENQQHHGAIWLNPEKQYTLDQLDVIFKTISFKLDTNQKMFFILQHADFLSEACSNSLLKSVEEPPQGYHFIFLAERLSQILPTIQSRCLVKSFYSENESISHHQLVAIFKQTTPCSPSQFLKLLDEEKPNEKETIEMLDQLLHFWLKENKKAIEEGNKQAYKTSKAMVSKIKTGLKKPPMPGSSKIFWRNFYLRANSLSSTR